MGYKAQGTSPRHQLSAYCQSVQMKLPRALFSYTKTLITTFLTALVLHERLLQSQLKSMLFEKIWFIAEVNPSTYSDNYSRSGFTGVTRSTHSIPDPCSDDTEAACYSISDRYLI